MNALPTNLRPLPTVPHPPIRLHIYSIAYKRAVHTLMALFSAPRLRVFRLSSLELLWLLVRLHAARLHLYPNTNAALYCPSSCRSCDLSLFDDQALPSVQHSSSLAMSRSGIPFVVLEIFLLQTMLCLKAEVMGSKATHY